MCYYSNMPNSVIIFNKKRGQTPLECINEAKSNDQTLKYLPITYAGRLDPLAEGVLILLVGDECLKKDEYLALSKVYEVEVLFGFSTDTYDLMGEVTETMEEIDGSSQSGFSPVLVRESTESSISGAVKDILFQFKGRISQKYPVYSSRPVNGKPLYRWAREEKLKEIEIPTHDVFIESIEVINEGKMRGDKLNKKIKDDIGKVKGDFRQAKILSIWNEILKYKKKEKYKTITLRISCSSGVYVRSISHEIGQTLRIPSLALNIKRIRVGGYTL